MEFTILFHSDEYKSSIEEQNGKMRKKYNVR